MYKTFKLAAVLTAALIIPIAALSAESFNLITTISGDSINDNFCHIANGHGDVNGDGYEDILIGAPGPQLGPYSAPEGYAKLFYGGAPFDTIPDLIFRVDGSEYFGVSCAFVGDINDDGYNDILIGDPYKTTNYWQDGAAYLYFGGVNMDTIPDITFIGEYFYHNLGFNVSGAGDVNGDGIDDWIINSPFDDLCAKGRIYLYFGSAHPDNICDVYFEGEREDGLRFQNPQLGDINGDGYDDLIFYTVPIFNNYSKVYIYFGGLQIGALPDIFYFGSFPSVFYSTPISGIGDFNNDGFNDWVIRINSDIHFYYGSSYPDTSADLIFGPELPCIWISDGFVGGDINGDGIDDIVTGGRDTSMTGTGYVLGYLGSSNPDMNYDYIFDSGIVGEWIGGAYVGLTDINGDGIMEVLAGAAQPILGEPNSWGPGRVWILTAQDNWDVKSISQPTPSAFRLSAYPNPFNNSTTISFTLPASGEISLKVYDISGREVQSLVTRHSSLGTHSVVWDAKNNASGVYFVRLEANGYVKTQKVVLLK